MKTYFADIIPKIQKYSQKLDDLTKLTNQHWVSLDEIKSNKKVYIFRANNQLLISNDGRVEKGTWEYLGNQSILIETKEESNLFKHGFFDDNVLALKLDSSSNYAFLINESKYERELNNISDVLKFLDSKYLNNTDPIGLTNPKNTNSLDNFAYQIISQQEKFDFIWGQYTKYIIKFNDSIEGELYKGGVSEEYFYMNSVYGKTYFSNFEDTVNELYLYLNRLYAK